MSRLKNRYHEAVKPELQKKFSYRNPMLIPSLKKVVINMGIAEVGKDKNALQDCVNELAQIAGQQPVICRAKKSISNFKLREGMPIGVKVTLRGSRMWDFLDRFYNITSPRIRDFRGFKPGGDKKGNMNIGLDDHTVFPELNLDKVKVTKGMNITFVTSSQTDDECIELLRLLGCPFKNHDVVVVQSASGGV
ncbi:MAG: 50S ribosomal protein L5 [Chlamydiia bacterium]|nr:50S ribosomal protein L5 [Chlamydiia bacterium]